MKADVIRTKGDLRQTQLQDTSSKFHLWFAINIAAAVLSVISLYFLINGIFQLETLQLIFSIVGCLFFVLLFFKSKAEYESERNLKNCLMEFYIQNGISEYDDELI